MEAPKRVLVVEDSATQASQLRLLLEEQGWGVECAPTAEDALEAVNRRVPDLLIVDYYLPGARGDELCRQIRRNVDTRGIPILMLTAEEAGAEAQRLESGADDYLPKSADHGVLLARVQALLATAPRDATILNPGRAELRRPKVLAIDDSPTYLEYLQQGLVQDGYAITTATSGTAGLERLRLEPFDCVVVDLIMPEPDGIAVCREVNESRRATDDHKVVLMLTARETKEDLMRALDSGADDFVGKSSDMVVIRGRIRALLRRKFVHEDNARILREMKERELQVVKAEAAKQVALVDRLERTAAELRRSNAELEQLAQVAAHELQTPLHAIARCCQWVLRDYQDRLDARAQNLLQSAVAAAMRLHALVDDVREYTRIGGAGRVAEPVRLGPLVEEALREIDEELRHTGGRVDVGPLPTVAGVTADLRRLLRHLLANAVKFRGTRPPAVSVSAERAGKEWRISVADSGIGIHPRHVERIFGVFKRLHHTDQYPGTGIGLALCRKIVEQHGGRIWVESEPGSGATFHFTLPDAKAAPDPATSAPGGGAPDATESAR
jgi:two-component system NtrC family sensor kinase